MALGALLTISQVALAGTVSGKIQVQGLRTPENVVVYIVDGPDTTLDFPAVKFVLDQKNLSFVPDLLVVPVGSTVQFPNNDKVEHNVFSLSRTKPFNLGNYGPGQTKSVTFDKTGIVELRCDLHAEMAGYILVLKNVYFGVSDKQGNYLIQDQTYLKRFGIQNTRELPAGSYIVRTWHEKLKSSGATVAIPATGNVVLDLKLKRGTPGTLYK